MCGCGVGRAEDGAGGQRAGSPGVIPDRTRCARPGDLATTIDALVARLVGQYIRGEPGERAIRRAVPDARGERQAGKHLDRDGLPRVP